MIFIPGQLIAVYLSNHLSPMSFLSKTKLTSMHNIYLISHSLPSTKSQTHIDIPPSCISHPSQTGKHQPWPQQRHTPFTRQKPRWSKRAPSPRSLSAAFLEATIPCNNRDLHGEKEGVAGLAVSLSAYRTGGRMPRLYVRRCSGLYVSGNFWYSMRRG